MNQTFTLLGRVVLGLLLVCPLLAGAQARSAKRGVAYGYHSAADMEALAPGVSWWYNWYTRPEASAAGVYAGLGLDYVPMQWGSAMDGRPLTADRLADLIPAGTKYLLSFNEPNFKGQSNLTPTQAAALWPMLEEVARRRKLKLVAPAVNYCGDCVADNGVAYTSPTQYLDAFFAAYPTAQVDYIAVHTYVCEERYLREKIAELKKYNKPIWVTEFACGDLPAAQLTPGAQQRYQRDAVNYLEKEPAVFRYAWFSGRNDAMPSSNLLGADGQLTPLGQQYVALPQEEEAGRLRPMAVTASSQESAATSAANVMDGNINTRWSSAFADPQYVQLDFGSVQNIDRVQLSWETAYARDYELQVSADGRTWMTALAKINSDGGVDNLTDLGAQGRYLRVYGTRRSSTYGYSLYEIDVFGTTARGLLAAQAPTTPATPGLRLYPNPTTAQLHLAPAEGSAPLQQLAVVDALGRTVLTSLVPAATLLDVSALPAGLYFVHALTTDQQRLSQRFVKR